MADCVLYYVLFVLSFPFVSSCEYIRMCVDERGGTQCDVMLIGGLSRFMSTVYGGLSYVVSLLRVSSPFCLPNRE